MLIDGRVLATGRVIEADVCVVGAGPAGITIARELASHGIHVALIEAGGTEHDEAGEAPFTGGESVGLPYYPLATTRVRAFGGTSHRWAPYQGWRTRPLDAADFEKRSWVPRSGWPVAFEELREYYRQAQGAIGLDPCPDPEQLDTPGAPPLSDDGGPFLTEVLRFADPRCFTATFHDLAADEHVTLALHTAVTGVSVDGNGSVTGLALASENGSRFAAKAGRYVLAMGGLENARLLLATGVGNEHDQVGRSFMEHPLLSMGVVHPRDTRAREALARYRRHYPNPPPGFDRRIVIGDERRRDERLLSGAFMLTPSASLRHTPGVRAVRMLRRGRRVEPRAPLDGRLLRRALTGSPDVARYLLHRLRGPEGEHDALEMIMMAEQAPDPDSRVLIGGERDAFGLPKVRLDWRLSEQDRRSMVRSAQVVAEAIREAGVADVELFYDDADAPHIQPDGHYHHIGTTRMSLDPREGVVDPDCRVHSVENLYAAGVSVFPTGGWANPTLTLVAMAMRLADHLAGQDSLGRNSEFPAAAVE